MKRIVLSFVLVAMSLGCAHTPSQTQPRGNHVTFASLTQRDIGKTLLVTTPAYAFNLPLSSVTPVAGTVTTKEDTMTWKGRLVRLEKKSLLLSAPSADGGDEDWYEEFYPKEILSIEILP